MRLKVQITLLFALGFFYTVSAQDGELSFYEKQAQKDAQNEQLSVFFSLEDEKDFWKDQKGYEKDLKTKSPLAYGAYMKAKKAAYSSHAESCKNDCTHSDFYYQQASFYFTYNGEQNILEEVIAETVQIASPRIL